MDMNIVGMEIQKLLWSHETTLITKLKADDMEVTVYFFAEKERPGRKFGCLVDNKTHRVFHRLTTTMAGLFTSPGTHVADARFILKNEYLRVYFTRHSSDALLLDAIRRDDIKTAYEHARTFCCLVSLHNTLTDNSDRPRPKRFFSFEDLCWVSRPRVFVAGKERTLRRIHTQKMLRGFKITVGMSVTYEFSPGKTREGKIPDTEQGLTLALTKSYPDGVWESAEDFVKHPNRKAIIDLYYNQSGE